MEDAERLLVAARQIAATAGRGSPEQARVNLGLARLHRAHRDARRASHYLGLARHSARAAHGSDSLGMARVEMETARQRQASGRPDAAVAAVEKALQIRRTYLSHDDPLVHQTSSELAWALQLAFEYPRAVETYEQVLTALQQRPDAPVRDQVIILNRLAWIHERAALLEKGQEYRDRAQRLAGSEAAGGDTSEHLLELGLEGLTHPPVRHRKTMEQMKSLASDWIEERHFHRDHFAFERQLLVSLRRLDRRVPTPKMRSSLLRDLRADFVAFAPARARDDSHHRYALPFAAGAPRKVAASSEGAHAYERVLLHAVDFEVPPGSAVLAAREGRVVRVVRGFEPTTERPAHPKDHVGHGIRTNRVIVLHDDDSYATYQPLASDIEVEEGDVVVRGQRLGRTSRVVRGETPIVHFDVRRNGTSARSRGVLTPEPVQARFTDVADRDGVPLSEHLYESRSAPAAPAPNAE